MAIDVLFIIMATFGFYFGFTFGLIKVVLMVVSLCLASFTAMAFTPMTTAIIIETFNIDSAFLPFLAFLITLIVVLMLARIVTKLIEETVDNKKFDVVSQVIGGLMMAFVFTLLYSVLVTFFGQAKVIKLVFNEEVMITKEDGDVSLVVDKRPGNEERIDTIRLYKGSGQPINKQFFAAAKFSSRFDPKIGKIQAYVGGERGGKKVAIRDTILLGSNVGMELWKGSSDNLLCFCDSTFHIESINDSIFFTCTDRFLSSRSRTSFFYTYIEVIPKRGTQILEQIIPFVKDFFEYMTVALERLDKGKVLPNPSIDKTSKEDNQVTPQPHDDSSLEPDPLPESLEDSIIYSIDTTIPTPVVTPRDSTSSEEEEEEEPIEYEG